LQGKCVERCGSGHTGVTPGQRLME
jgi:hypothetical protein